MEQADKDQGDGLNDSKAPLNKNNGEVHSNSHDRDSEDKGDNSMTYFQKIKYSRVFRDKFILSLVLSWSFVCLGWLVGQFGPSFLDLRIITNTRLEKATFFMTSHSVGYLAGSLITGVLFDKFNRIFLVFLTVFFQVFVSAVIPWCSLFELMIIMQACRGFFGGGLDVAGNALLVSTWGEDKDGRSFMQGLHFAFALGGILSPLATAPFLAKEIQPISSTTESLISTADAMTINSTSQPGAMVTNTSNTLLYNFSSSINTTETPGFEMPESRLFIPFLMSAAINVTAAIPLFLIFLKDRKRKKKEKKERNDKTDDKEESNNARQLPIITKVLVLLSVCFFLGLYCAVEDSFNSLLPTFCVKQMLWSKVDAAIATSVFWASFGSGRFLGIFLARCFRASTLIIVCTIFMAISYVGFYVSAIYKFNEGIWVCSATAGFGMSVVFPCVFTWTEENLLKVSGKVASFFLIAASCGSMINPIFLGTLMDQWTPMWFSYILLGQSVLLVILYFLLLFLARMIKNRYGNAFVDIKIEIREDGDVDEEGSLLELDVINTEIADDRTAVS